MPASRIRLAAASAAALLAACAVGPSTTSTDYEDLLQLFADWRAFEQPPLQDGAPDYTAARMARAHGAWRGLKARLDAIDPSSWPTEQQVDWHLVRAELNGFDFNCRVLRPWQRDPAFYQQVWTYQSDTPAHEGPCNHALVELWTYDFPLAPAEARRLQRELETVPALLAQARDNLTGNARDLWIAGARTMRQQATALRTLGGQLGADAPEAVSASLRDA